MPHAAAFQNTLFGVLSRHVRSSKSDLGNGLESLKAVQVLTAGPSAPSNRGKLLTTHHRRAVLAQHYHISTNSTVHTNSLQKRQDTHHLHGILGMGQGA